MFARKGYLEKDDARGRNGWWLNGVLGGRLYYLMRRVANHAVGMCQSICMKVGLLNRGAYEEKDGAHEDTQNAFAHFGRSILPHTTSHRYQYYTPKPFPGAMTAKEIEANRANLASVFFRWSIDVDAYLSFRVCPMLEAPAR
jgi:hypothetical protein